MSRPNWANVLHFWTTSIVQGNIIRHQAKLGSKRFSVAMAMCPCTHFDIAVHIPISLHCLQFLRRQRQLGSPVPSLTEAGTTFRTFSFTVWLFGKPETGGLDSYKLLAVSNVVSLSKSMFNPYILFPLKCRHLKDQAQFHRAA